MRIDGYIRTNHRPRLAPVRGERLKWEKQIKTSAPVGFRRQETKINDIISCRTGRSLPWKRNQVKKSTTRQLISRRRFVTPGDNEIEPDPHYGMPKQLAGGLLSTLRITMRITCTYAHTYTSEREEAKGGII
ncbi:hypothetical protein ALC62_10695 [Cyphomyrmex costatus]|uniref:Uncharacterized protein n=1 Tax=Cyphomyrmex costatus TaxID=456900 RepID=A0A195CD46_9HYME|nr:hypothetical protein ALC62_10695 [Cyphomyrmex costatus]